MGIGVDGLGVIYGNIGGGLSVVWCGVKLISGRCVMGLLVVRLLILIGKLGLRFFGFLRCVLLSGGGGLVIGGKLIGNILVV